MAKPDEAARWAQADRLADGIIDQAWRTRRRRIMISVVLVAILSGAVVGVLIGIGLHATGHHQHRHHHDAPLWRAIAGLLVILVGAGVEARTLLRMRASGQLARNRHSPLLALRWRERRAILRQIKGKSPVQPGHLKVARAAAVRLDQQRGVRGLFIGLVIVWLGEVLQSASVTRLGFAAAMILFYPVIIAAINRDAARAADFLAQHPPDQELHATP